MVLSILLGVLAAAPVAGAAADPSIPHLRRQGTATQLIVDGKPFLDPRRRARQLHRVEPRLPASRSGRSSPSST